VRVDRTARPAARGPGGDSTTALELGAGLGGEWRSSDLDAQPRLGARLSRGPLSVVLETALARTGAPEIEILEWQLQAGVGYRAALGARLGLGADLLLGALTHHYRVPGSMALDRTGTEVDVLASLALALTWGITGPLSIGLRVAPGLASSSRRHVAAQTLLWERGAARIEGGVALYWRF
jgi:hypothetical protein